MPGHETRGGEFNLRFGNTVAADGRQPLRTDDWPLESAGRRYGR